MRIVLDPKVELLNGGRVLVGGDPTRIMKLSAAGAEVINRWSFGPSTTRTSGEETLAKRLVATAMAHPVPSESSLGVGDVAIIVPVRDRPEVLDRCLGALVLSGVEQIVVVDDGSVDAAAHEAVATRHGAHLVRRMTSGGPAAARMAGVLAIGDDTEFIGFVDSDIEVNQEWLAPLLGLMGDAEVAVAAPRVQHRLGLGGLIDRYEVANSPLDLGVGAAPIRAGTQVSYVPAAALVVRRTAFEAVGGFDPSMEVGEDVDLLWRLADAGWTCRYEPASVVTHSGRSDLGSMLRRRVDYGRSAADLDKRHPGQVPPVRGSTWSYAFWAAVVAKRPLVAAAIGAMSVGRAAKALREVEGGNVLAAQVVTRGHLGVGRQLLRAFVRPWFPVIVVMLAIGSRRHPKTVALILGGLLIAPTEPWLESQRTIGPASFIVLWFADESAYSAGVWAGCVQLRSLRALLPAIVRGSQQNV